MPRVRPLEIKALLPLLEQDWETPEDLAAALIQALDEVRASRTSYVGVIAIPAAGLPGGQMMIGMGPYPGYQSAVAALARHPILKDENFKPRVGVVTIDSPLAYERKMRELEIPPAKKAG